MTKLKVIKWSLVGGWFLAGLLWVTVSSFSQATSSSTQSASTGKTQEPSREWLMPALSEKTADFVGSEACRNCHEDQFKNFAKTVHAKLEREPSWRDRVQGCESCHGPGREHVEAGGDRTKIRTFENETAKQVSETCLACHSGREEHNNFRRGEHWRNNVGCIDCHSSHDPDPSPASPASHTLVADTPAQRLGASTVKLLKTHETQLCIGCHSEQKAQFTMPFRHKVLEGFMKCSDCHNPHGGFETRQLRLTTGTDAACVKCHTDKQGPFVFEHSPVKVEGCSICHTPHGANNPKLLARSHVFQLCIECHSNAHQLSLGEEGGAPNLPSFHNLTTERIRNCTTCHIAIHGSQTHNFFFR